MSLPNNDREGRFRNKTIAFRVSDDENREIESLVAFSDMTKQDYLISRALCRDIHVRPTIRVQKTMSAELCRIADELGRLSDAEMHDKDMAAAKGKENLKMSEVSDLGSLIPPSARQVPVSTELVTPARRRRKVPKGFFKN